MRASGKIRESPPWLPWRPPVPSPSPEIEFTVAFDLLPSGHFGIPGEGYQLVLPSSPSATKAPNSQPIDLTLVIGGFRAHLSGNHLEVTVPSSTMDEARMIAEAAVERFLRFLCIEHSPRFEHRFAGITSSMGMSMGAVRAQGLSQVFFQPENILRNSEVAATLSCSLDDDLDRALTYYDHARQLLDLASRVNSGFPKSFWRVEYDYQTWLTDVVLNLWKAQAQILGEGKRRAKRMALLNLDSLDRQILEELDTLRNSGNVAHTHQERDGRRDLREVWGKCGSGVERLLRTYARYVKSSGTLPT